MTESLLPILIFTCLIAAPAACSARASIELDEEEVVFRIKAPDASKVSIAGDFNNWNHTMDSMVQRNGVWEVRLYLVPGRYRYMFVIDGVETPDPDNPNRDDEGRSFFIFHEEDGAYEILYETRAEQGRLAVESYDTEGALAAVAWDDYSLLTASAGASVESDEGLRGRMLVGLEYEGASDYTMSAYLLRASGWWEKESVKIGAWHRAGMVDFEDPLSLFGEVGPFNYPLGLFCRGGEASALWKGSFEGRVLFAGRIAGYLSGLETRGYEDHAKAPMLGGDPTDKDMIGLKVGGGAGPVDLRYLFRHDRSRCEDYWFYGNRYMFDAYSTRTTHGLSMEVEMDGITVVTAEYLTGWTEITADYIYSDAYETALLVSDSKIGWEKGYRALAALSWSGGAFSGSIKWCGTSIEGDPSLREERGASKTDAFEAQAGYETRSLGIRAGLGVEMFDAQGGAGRTFWLQRRNFWLDGDLLGTGLLQFLDSENVWKADLYAEEKGCEQVPGPYRLDAHFKAKARWADEYGSGMFEISGGKGLMLNSLLSIHADLRYASYRDERWVGKSSFLDVWVGLRAALGGSGWAAIGVGAAPHRYDKWYFDFTDGGRESYLLDKGLFELVDTQEEERLIGVLGEAENALSDEWRLGFEAGYSF